LKTLSSIALATLAAAGVPASGATTVDVVAPDRMPRVATVDDRFQSYNIEMVEVTGGVARDDGIGCGLVGGYGLVVDPSSLANPSGRGPPRGVRMSVRSAHRSLHGADRGERTRSRSVFSARS
jgi:hypothetical protein